MFLQTRFAAKASRWSPITTECLSFLWHNTQHFNTSTEAVLEASNSACANVSAPVSLAEIYEKNELSVYLGITAQEYKRVVEKISSGYGDPNKILDPKFNHHIFRNLRFLEQKLGFSQVEQKKLVVGFPEVLKYSRLVLRIKLDWYVDECGLTLEELKKMILRYPRILGYNIDKHVQPTIDWLLELGLTKEQFAKCMLRFPPLFALSLEKNIMPKIGKFLDLGLTKQEVLHMISMMPSILGLNFEQNVQKKVDWLLDDVGLDRDSVVHKFIAKRPMVMNTSLDVLKTNYEWICTLDGFTKQRGLEAVTKTPYLLVGNTREKIKRVQFAREVLGKDLEDIFRMPLFLNYSFEGRIMLRAAFLDHLGIDCRQRSLNMLCQTGDSDFVRVQASSTIEEYNTFKQWWGGISREEKLQAIKTSMYNPN